MTKKTPRKVDIFKVLENIDDGNVNFYDSLTVEEQKSISMVVLMQWMYGMDNTQQLKAIESIVNPFIYSLSSHKSLLFKLMTIASSGTKKRYSWGPKNKNKSMTLSTAAIASYYGLSKSDAKDYIGLLGRQEIIDIAMGLGYDDSELKKLKKEHE